MIPLLIEIFIQLMLILGAAGIILIPLWFFHMRGGSARPRLLGNSSERGGFTLHTAAPTKRARETPGANQRP